jgi:hypothetical protein
LRSGLAALRREEAGVWSQEPDVRDQKERLKAESQKGRDE